MLHNSVPLTLVEVGRWLSSKGYSFVTPTPASHRLVNDRASPEAQGVRDVFGWSRRFKAQALPAGIFEALNSCSLLMHLPGGWFTSAVRYSSLGGHLFAHSAFPTVSADAVFFGPDTYRFVSFLQTELQREPLRTGARIIDVGCGAGPGGILLAKHSDSVPVLTDINPIALEYACANAELAGVSAKFALGNLFAPVSGSFDCIIANPPYLNDPGARTYRHGGGQWGSDLSARIVREGVDRLAPGGRLMLYTGAAVVGGQDMLLRAIQDVLACGAWTWHYREIDPDVFGEELASPAYADVERIAAVGLIVNRI